MNILSYDNIPKSRLEEYKENSSNLTNVFKNALEDQTQSDNYYSVKSLVLGP
jgi:hypothetical protein